ncbi:metallophosphoesterase [Humisphaera borealis]|uniref:Metallophosphoesterase n=1 Tax=Humisphaera borealis TaxID=2807512 RepID=A0A7M2WX60_9BACT|nr:metallophosphoesterase [Humisphaera borealis]QOV89934.1 metallophosphoesterase [Humisphaera borealis]
MNWVIGDIHGMLRPLRALVERVSQADPQAKFNFVGDYINRGPDSKGVLDFLIDLKGARFCRGNHDDIFTLLLYGQPYVQNPSATDEVVAFQWFVQYGLWETLLSYGVEPYEIDAVLARPSPESVLRLLSVVPESHRRFARDLVPVIEGDTYFIAHAMWNVDEPDEPSIAARLAENTRLRYQIIWGRYGRELTRPKRWKRTGYFGHTPVQTYPRDVQTQEHTPIRGPGIVLLDTAAALTPEGRLSAVSIESGELIQVDRLGGPIIGQKSG